MVKNQHYVPRFYLKNFLDAQEKFWVLDTEKDKIFISNPKAVANENFFYDLPELNEAIGVDQAVENYLAEIEAVHAPFFTYLINGIDERKIRKIDDNMRSILGDFLVIQILRTKEYREQMSHSFANFQDKLINSGWFDASQQAAIKSAITKSDAKKDQLEQLFFDNDFKTNLFNILNSHIWMIFKNITDTPYCTSDNPIVKYPHLVREHRSDNGFKSEGIEIALPLSSNHLLVLLERTTFKHYEEYENEVLVHSKPENVVYYNSLQVLGCNRMAFCERQQFDLYR
jgi:hypothetical protein